LYFYLATGLKKPLVQEFLATLTEARRAAYVARFRKYALGLQLRKDQYRALSRVDSLYEFKDIESKSRIIFTKDHENAAVLLHGFGGKKEDKTDSAEITLAERVRDEYRKRRSDIEQQILQDASKGRLR